MIQYVWKYDDNKFVFLNGETATTITNKAAINAQSFATLFVNDFEGYEEAFNSNVVPYIGSERPAILFYDSNCAIDTSDYLSFTSLSGESTVYLSVSGDSPHLQYCFSDDMSIWFDFPFNSTNPVVIEEGKTIYLRGYNINGFNTTNRSTFVMTGSIAASGDIMTIINLVGGTLEIPGEHCFSGLFKDCVSLITPPKLPATTLKEYCYYEMFSGCTQLTKTPILPAEQMEKYCYGQMFSGCEALRDMTELESVRLADGCYIEMFSGCKSLEFTNDLPATELKNACYKGMFKDCISIEVPYFSLKAEILATKCYKEMFSGCSSLISAPDISAIELSDECCYQMFKDCIKLYEAPELYSEFLVDKCYYEMFSGCESLDTITVYFNDWNTTSNSTTNWVYGVPFIGLFTFVGDFVGEKKMGDNNNIDNPSFVPWCWLNKVVFNDNIETGTVIDTQYVYFGEYATNIGGGIREHYTFVEWNTKKDGTGTSWGFDYNTVNGDIMLYAIWEPVKYEFKFESQNESVTINSQYIEYKKQATEPKKPETIGKVFKGWYTTPQCTKKWDFSTEITKDVTVYGKWEVEKYTVTFNVDGKAKEPQPIMVDFGSTITLPELEKIIPGYELDGWYTSKTFTKEWKEDVNKVYSDTTIYAKFVPAIYEVTFIISGTVIDSYEVDYGSKLNQPQCEIYGYDITEWVDGVGNKWDFDKDVVKKDTELTAVLGPKTFDVIFVMNGHGQQIPTQHLKYGVDTIESPGEQSAIGYNFGGWYSDINLSNEFVFGNVITETTYIYAKWSIKQCIVNYFIDSSSIELKVYEYGSLINNVEVSKYGYTFIEWNTKQDGSGDAWDFDNDRVISDISLYAIFEINTYTVSFDLMNHGDVNIPEGQEVEYLSLATRPTLDPIESSGNYLFSSWYGDNLLTTEFDFTTTRIVGNTTIYAKWIGKDITVNFDGNGHGGGTIPTSQYIKYNEKIIDPSTQGHEPFTEDYKFIGWYIDSACTPDGLWDFNLNVNDDTITIENNVATLFAKWESLETEEYLFFSAHTDSIIGVRYRNDSLDEPITEYHLQYRYVNDSVWNDWDLTTIAQTTPLTYDKYITLERGEKVYVKGNITGPHKFTFAIYSNDDEYGEECPCKGMVECGGNILSISYGDNFVGQTYTFKLNHLFSRCSGIITPPLLPATMLSIGCYDGLFKNCVNLIKAPLLPAKSLEAECYQEMFAYCEKIDKITCLATNISATWCTYKWLNGVSNSGIFYGDASMQNTWSNGNSGVPGKWTYIPSNE